MINKLAGIMGVSPPATAGAGVRTSLLFLAGLLVMAVAPPAHSWGERGHDIITRVAVRHLIADGAPRLTEPFQQREFMLGHLANVPDIVWRAADRTARQRRLNRPTHYINLDLAFKDNLSVYGLPRTYPSFASLAKGPPVSIGSAPWRAVQLFRLMRDAFRQTGQVMPPAGKPVAREQETPAYEEYIGHINAALLYGGIMSHFVGDLANPHHAAADYDGRQTGNGGLHAYFESMVVAALDLGLAEAVLRRVQAGGLIDQELLGPYDSTQRMEIKNDPLLLTFALTINSRANLPRLVGLDDRYSLLERSNDEQKRAKRRPPAEVAPDYRPFIVERLALGAAVLAHLWRLAWEQAGRPDLSAFHSYYYPAKPNFIYPDYLPANRLGASDGDD